MEKRLFSTAVSLYDHKHKTSFIREIEMRVDQCVTNDPAYAIQFMNDFRIYGLREAIVYMRNFLKKNHHRYNVEEIDALFKLHETLNTLINK